jgi:hypothetical protein
MGFGIDRLGDVCFGPPSHSTGTLVALGIVNLLLSLYLWMTAEARDRKGTGT